MLGTWLLLYALLTVLVLSSSCDGEIGTISTTRNLEVQG